MRYNGWKPGKLKDIANIVMGQSPKGNTCNIYGEGIPLLNGPTEFTYNYPVAVQFTISPKKVSNVGDLLFCVRGSTVGRMNWSDKNYAIGRGLAAISPKIEGTNHFIRAVIDYNLKKLIRISTGSTFPNISRGMLEELDVLIPEEEEILLLSKVLESINSKIILNNELNKTLEEIAQVLFKRWFIDFEFPCIPENYYKLSRACKLCNKDDKENDFEKVCTYKRVGGLPVPDGSSWFVYVLLCEDGSFYKGITTDLYRRFYEHYTGKGAEWTKAHKPVKVIHYEKFNTQEEARKREEELKSGYGIEWIKTEYKKLLNESNHIKIDSDSLEQQYSSKSRLMIAGEMVQSEMGMIPNGWSSKNFGDISKELRARVRDLNAIVLSVVKTREIVKSDEFFTNKVYSKDISKYKLVNKYNFAYNPSRINIGSIGMLEEDIQGAISPVYVVFEVEDEYKWFIKFMLEEKRILEEIKARSFGSVRQALKYEDLSMIRLIYPNKDIINKFNKLYVSLKAIIHGNKKENHYLVEFRDTLLPKLMSGEIRVSDIDKANL